MEAEEPGAEAEEGLPRGGGEFFAVREGECLASALHYFVVAFVDYVEGVAGERPGGGLVWEDGRGRWWGGRRTYQTFSFITRVVCLLTQ